MNWIVFKKWLLKKLQLLFTFCFNCSYPLYSIHHVISERMCSQSSQLFSLECFISVILFVCCRFGDHTWWCSELSLGSLLRNYIWWCLGNHKGCPESESNPCIITLAPLNNIFDWLNLRLSLWIFSENSNFSLFQWKYNKIWIVPFFRLQGGVLSR